MLHAFSAFQSNPIAFCSLPSIFGKKGQIRCSLL
jgi:hypothetical protein